MCVLVFCFILAKIISAASGFEETLYWYDHLEQHLGWKNIGKVLCSGVMGVGDIAGKPELKDAYDLGNGIK